MMTFDMLSGMIRDHLPAEWADKGVYYYPGPNLPDQPVDHIVNLSIDGGEGLILDGVLSNISWQIKTTGRQAMYATAEQLAWDIDTALLNLPSGQYGGRHVASIYRVGGPPSHFEFDDAERTQFVCSYFFDVESGLQPI